MQNSLYSAKRWLSSTAIRMFSSPSDDVDVEDDNNKLSEMQPSQITSKRGRGRPRKPPNSPPKPRFIAERKEKELGKRRPSSVRSCESQHEDCGPNDGEIRFLLTFKALPNNLQILAKVLYPKAHNKYEEHRITCKILNDENNTRPREIFIPTFRKLSPGKSFRENQKKLMGKELISDEDCLQRHRPLELAEKRERRREEELVRYELYIRKLSKEYPELLNRKYPITSDGTKAPRSNIMPHECPKLVVPVAHNSNDAAEIIPRSTDFLKERPRMVANEKENSRIGTSSSGTPKTPIPEHIHDTNAKTFYKLGQFLGKGGFASCYQVTSEATGKQYAVKIVPKSSLTKPKQKNKLLQEIKIHQSLRHDHIVRIYRVFEDDNFVYIVMELCECQTMLELLRQKTRLTDEEARPILLQLLAVVEYLHTNHVIHRDLKLGNLFLKQGPIIKLGDFGLATLVYGENDRKRTICGTPNYIAPEILAGGEKGHSYEVDIWSFGVIMYTILVGHPPFQRQEVKEIYEKIKVANFEFPKNVPISLSAQDLINRLLHPNPEMRPKISDIRAHSYFSGEAPSPILKATRRELIGILEPIEGAKNVASSESGLIFSIQQSIRKILTNYSSVTSQFDRVYGPKDVYLVKWMDFSSKYGIGYLLSNASSGFYFNDGTSLILSSNKERGHFFQPGEENKKILVRESFVANNPKESVRQKLEIMLKFDGFLQAPPSFSNHSSLNEGNNELVFVVKFFRTSQATFFRLSHRVLQVNFFDHCKLIFCDEGRMISFIDQEKRCLIFPFSISRVHLSSAITSKLQYVADIFNNMMKTSSSSHINSIVRGPSKLGQAVYTSNSK